MRNRSLIQSRLKNLIAAVKESRGHKASFFVRNKNEDEAEILIYDVIDEYWGIAPTDIVAALNEITAPLIHVRINSPGGYVTDGMAIMTAIANHPAEIHTHIDGMAASMASILAMSGVKVHMTEGAWYMIHDPWGITIGNARDHRDAAELLDQFGGELASIYAKRTEPKDGLTRTEILEAMAAETWYTAAEAKEAGFVDSIVDVVPDQAQATFTGGVGALFGNAPDEVAQQLKAAQENAELSRRTVENLLRDAGASRTEAKLMAKGAVRALQHREDAECAALLDSIESAINTLRSTSNA